VDVQPENLFIVSAELAVAFVGFASLVGVFLARNSGTLPGLVRMTLRALLDYGLLALLACTIPLLLGLTTAEEPAIWTMSSQIFLAAWVSYVVISHYYYREVVVEAAQPTLRLTWVLLAGDVLSILLLVGNAVGWPFTPSPLIYFAAAIVWRLAGSALCFRMLLGEFWSDTNG
jgi:hypothetical protein